MPVMTVLGPVAAKVLGVTLMHEHLIHAVGGVEGSPDEIMHDESQVAEELADYRAAGGRTVVDLTTVGIGPSPAALCRVARRAGLNVVAGTGYYIEDRLPPEVRAFSQDELCAAMQRDLTEGFPGTHARAGIIGELGCGTLSGSDITPFETRVLRAAARAQQATGAAITVHTQIDFGPQGLWALDILEEAGADLSRVVLAHCDARIDLPYCYALMQRGAVVEFSAVGRARHTALLADGTPVPDTEARVKAVAQLAAEGHAGQVLLSHDVCARTHLRAFGGGGFSNLIADTLPRLRAAGVTEAALQTMLVHNPARLLEI